MVTIVFWDFFIPSTTFLGVSGEPESIPIHSPRTDSLAFICCQVTSTAHGTASAALQETTGQGL